MCRSDEEMVKFMQLMNSIWNICGNDVVTAFDLSPFKTICDLGGKCVCVCVCVDQSSKGHGLGGISI